MGIKIGDMFENKYGKYEVISILDEKWGNGERKVKVKFEDGYEVLSTPYNIKIGRIRNPFYRSVANIGYLGTATYKHFLYNRWHSMISRCYNKNDKDYKNYGEKGVYVDKRWHCFANYIEDVVKLDGYDEEKVKNNKLELDKDLLSNEDNKNYGNKTCKWISSIENNKERRHRNQKYFKCIRISDSYEEITNSQIEFAKKYSLNNDCITHCLKGRNKSHKGWIFTYI